MAPERQLEPTKPFEGAEVNRERLKSYQKALMAGDYDTARFLNLEGVSEEEQRKAREEVFSQKIGVMKIGWEAKHVIDQVESSRPSSASATRWQGSGYTASASEASRIRNISANRS